MKNRDRLVDLLVERSARRGDFVLASGAKSDLYVDVRMTSMSPDGLALIGPMGLAAIEDAGWKADSVGGLTLGADPISYAIAYASVLAGGRLIRSFTVRKEAKVHGTGKLIEGPFTPSDGVVVIEDVITTGGSALKAIDAIRGAGAVILGVLSVVDREEGGRVAIESAGYQVRSLVTATEIRERLP